MKKLRILPLVAVGIASLSGLVGCGKKPAADSQELIHGIFENDKR